MNNIVLSPIRLEELIEQISNKVFLLINKDLKHNYSPKEKELKDFLTREETASLCSIKSLTTLWNWEQDGRLIPTMRAGKKPLYKRQDVLDFLNQKK